MNILKLLTIVSVALAIMTFESDIGSWLSNPGSQSFVTTAEARVGRPLTPVSVAGVARRTVRRCAVGVYNCSLPGVQAPESLVGQTLKLSGTGEDLSKHQIIALR